MKIKKGDNVIVIAGKDKGKKGKVVKAMPKKSLIIVEAVNVIKKHQRATKAGTKGQMVEKAMPIHVSNVLIVDPESNKQSRVGKKMVGDKLVRVSKKSGVTLK